METSAGTSKRPLTERETAQYIGMSRLFLRRSRMEGKREGHTAGPPWVKIGRAVRYSVDDLSGWIAVHRKGAEVPQS